ncbi:hypothetical protein KY5_7213 [Streptomyces formicae]|uniref:Uncharacterized protein n=1 Tax=Streptomyces formicae TaxID=1616117 RepID=A0A291QKK8_9ACTN|nr:hypothetical protein KY5_7213 [Streptomyces formicae]
MPKNGSCPSCHSHLEACTTRSGTPYAAASSWDRFIEEAVGGGANRPR